jgi:hypothetical protein
LHRADGVALELAADEFGVVSEPGQAVDGEIRADARPAGLD